MTHDELFPFDDAPLGLEKDLWRSGFSRVAGVDEVGRGAFAGPVVAAAVVFPHRIGKLADRIRDSKKLTPEAREELCPLIEETALAVGIGVVESEEIDRINILEAALKAMKIAIEALDPAPEICLIDGNVHVQVGIPQRLIVKGDDRVISIGAASIMAKVTRDHLMVELHHLYPAYGFADHKGYGTDLHRRVLKEIGPCPAHRLSFDLGLPATP
ncbi:MAG: ribonuclease HII [Pseudomonadota bacterium]